MCNKKLFDVFYRIVVIMVSILFFGMSCPVWAEEPPPELFEYVPELTKWGMDPVLVAAVREQNAKKMTLASIKIRDEEWRAMSGVDDEMRMLMNNSAAKRLLELEQQKPFFIELFLMDDQGANVAMTNKTSDYWQGDEAKFIQSYKDGVGDVHIGDVEYDDSVQAYLVQVSVPVMESGGAIGALTIGINLDELLQ
ncbi:PDC sensor domain-containing protein [Gynuella sp.]|uniref:PDC sensor domain-containing protein n=1 Tax=Gynuella sp. TaxID=2969146 RepID=UPI003D0E1CFF